MAENDMWGNASLTFTNGNGGNKDIRNGELAFDIKTKFGL